MVNFHWNMLPAQKYNNRFQFHTRKIIKMKRFYKKMVEIKLKSSSSCLITVEFMEKNTTHKSNYLTLVKLNERDILFRTMRLMNLCVLFSSFILSVEKKQTTTTKFSVGVIIILHKDYSFFNSCHYFNHLK